MSAQKLFLNQIYRVKKQVFHNALRRSITISLVIFLGGVAVATGISFAGFYPPFENGFVYGLLAGGSLVLSPVYVFLTRKKFIDILIDIDRRLKLKDRISTAYEYRTHRENSVLAARLLEDAGRRLSKFRNRQIVPIPFSTLHWFLGVLILINISLFFIGRFYPVSDETMVSEEKREKIVSMLETYPQGKEKKQKKQINKRPSENRLKEIRKLSEILRDGPITKDRLLSSLNRLLTSVQEEYPHLAKTLVSKVGIQQIDHVAVQKTVRLEKLSLNEQKQLQRMLKKIIDSRMLGELSNDLSILNEQNKLVELLERIIAEVESDKPDNRIESDGKAGGNPETKDSTQRRESARSTQPKGTPTERHRDGKNADSGTESDPDKQNNMAGEDAPDSRDDVSSTAGDAKSDGKEKAPHEIEKLEGIAFSDKTISTQPERYSAPVRSLANIGKAKVKSEDMVRPYQQEIESILSKADIPANYRTYIKNYFISIGLDTGKKTR